MESFENQNIADIMNKKFINIKVDREERPDLDNVFQKSLAILTDMPGGWPLSMFLDENGVPFSGGTYFPLEEIHGRPSFKNILNQVSEFYEKNRDKIIQQASQIKNVFQKRPKKNLLLLVKILTLILKLCLIILILNGEVSKEAQNFRNFMFLKAFYIFIKKIKIKNFTMLLKFY